MTFSEKTCIGEPWKEIVPLDQVFPFKVMNNLECQYVKKESIESFSIQTEKHTETLSQEDHASLCFLYVGLEFEMLGFHLFDAALFS